MVQIPEGSRYFDIGLKVTQTPDSFLQKNISLLVRVKEDALKRICKGHDLITNVILY